MTLFELFWLFFYIGLFTIGGGQVSITIMFQELVEKSMLIDAELFYNMLAISESTPGPIGINMATYIGYEMFGLAGGIITTFGTIAPSLIIIMIISRYFGTIQNKPIVKDIFSVLRPAATGLVWVVAVSVFFISVYILTDAQNINFWAGFSISKTIFWIITIILLFKTKIPVIVYIFIGAIFGIFCL